MVAPTDQTAYLLSEKVQELFAALLARHPKMPTLLREIHQTLSKYPEQVTLMSEEDIHVVVEGLKVQTGVEFAATATKSSGKSLTAKISKLGVDAF